MGPPVLALVEAITEQARSPVGINLAPANGCEATAVVEGRMLLERRVRELAHHILANGRHHTVGRTVHRFGERRPGPRILVSRGWRHVTSAPPIASRARRTIPG